MAERKAEVIKLPARYDSEDQIIYDANGNRICDVRGWGWIQYGRTGDEGESYQDSIGKALVDGFNKEWVNNN